MADVRLTADLKVVKKENKGGSYMEFFVDYTRPTSVTVPDTVLSEPTSYTFTSSRLNPFEFENALLHICEEVGYTNMPSMEPDYLRKCIKTVIYHEPATIVKWKDGTKTVVKCGEYDTYDKEKGLMACIIKKLTGNTGRWNEILKEWVDYEDK